mgnify:CR=1 FL=1
MVMMPGTTVAMKQPRMLIPVVQPNTIMGMLGGINVPRIEEHVTREVAKPLE